MGAGVSYKGTKMGRPIVTTVGSKQAEDRLALAALGQSLVIHEWSGSGPDYLHVHYTDDEAWHVLEGSLTFRFEDRQVEAPAGTTIFVPAGVPHTYYETHGPARYLIILTPRLHELIAALFQAPREQHDAIMRQFESEILE
jgi:mannose-6-phosphate isomerase-like protein (cupin superfamily)